MGRVDSMEGEVQPQEALQLVLDSYSGTQKEVSLLVIERTQNG